MIKNFKILMNLMPTPLLNDWNSMLDSRERCCGNLNVVHVYIGTISKINKENK